MVDCDPPDDGPLCIPAPERVTVRSPMDPEGEPGPAGTVYVITSMVGLDEPAEADPLGPEPARVTVFACDELPEGEPGTVTVRG